MPSHGTACDSTTWKSTPERLLQEMYSECSPLNKHKPPKAIEWCYVSLLQAEIISCKMPGGSFKSHLEIFTLSLSHSSFKSFHWFQGAQLELTVRTEFRFLKSQDLTYFFFLNSLIQTCMNWQVFLCPVVSCTNVIFVACTGWTEKYHWYLLPLPFQERV